MTENELAIGNFQECLRSYQKSMVFASTAAFFLLLYTFEAQSIAPAKKVDAAGLTIPLLQAWTLAFIAFVLFFCHAISCLNRANKILENMKLTSTIRDALIQFPSFATHPSSWVRIGTVFLPTMLVFGSFVYEVYNTWHFTWVELGDKLAGTVIIMIIVFVVPILTMRLLKTPLGSSIKDA